MLKPSSLPWPKPSPLQLTAMSVVSDYVALTKPPIILLLLVTAVGAMFLAAQGTPPLARLLMLVFGGAAAAGGAGAINHYLDRDIDGMMTRTRLRPLPGRRIPPRSALIFGVLLNVFAFALLGAGVNLLTAVLTLTGTLFYVFVYTWWLKRATPQNIVIGGAAGAVPPLAGWAAVTGSLEVPALFLFGIIFLWTPAHFWALALLLKEDYARAGIPMLPVVKGVAATHRGIAMYTAAVVALSIGFYFSTDTLGPVYLFSAVVLGVAFLALALRLAYPSLLSWWIPRDGAELRVYLYSLLYLALLFIAVMVDSVVVL